MSRSFDRVILHTHPHDCIPVLAFAKQGGPPVAMFNHAHFSFNLGSTVSDMIINTVEYYRDISRRHRFARSTELLTGVAGMLPTEEGIVDKAAARRELSLPEQATVIMSLAHEPYYRPMEGYNFFRTLETLMGKLPDAYFLIVGVREGQSACAGFIAEELRLIMTGVVLNPIVHYRASDLFQNRSRCRRAVDEAIGNGEAFPVAVYGPGESILHVNQPTFAYAMRAPDERAYVDHVTHLAGRKTEILQAARQMRAAIRAEDEHFESKLDALNSRIDALTHKPGDISATKISD